MDLSQAVASGVAAGLSGGGGRKRLRLSTKSSGSKKGKRSGGRSAAVTRSIAWHGRPVPPILKTQLRYSTSLLTITSATGQGEYQMNVQDLYDPDRTGAGHQCMGFDELAALYDSYRVEKCDYKVTFSSADSGTNTLCSHAVWVNDVTTVPSTVGEAQEQAGVIIKYTKWNSEPKSITMSINPWESIGQTKAQYDADTNNRAFCTTSPVNTNVIHFQSGTGAASFIVSFNIEIEYTVLFLDPKRTNPS